MTAIEARLLSLYDMGVVTARMSLGSFAALQEMGLAAWRSPKDRNPRKRIDMNEKVIWYPTAAGLAAAARITDQRRRLK